MWVDYRGSLSTVYSDGGISTCGEIIEAHSVQSTMMGRSVEIMIMSSSLFTIPLCEVCYITLSHIIVTQG